MGFVIDNTEDDDILDRMLDMANAIDGKVGTYACDLRDEHIRALVIEQFMEQILTLPGAESWNTIMDVWTEIQAMARSILDGEDDFDREDLHTEMENFVALIDAYFGWY